MKLTITLAASLAVMSVANGALYTLNNGTGSTASGVQTSDGKVFRSGTTDGQILGSAPQNVQTSAGPGIVSFGFFSTDEFSNISSPTDLVALFTTFGVSGTFAAGSTGGNRSVLSSPQNQTIGTTFNTKNIYLFVGNGTTYLNSTEFLIAKMSDTFNVADDVTNAVTPKVITINPGNSTALFGSEIANVFTTNTDASQTQGWQMAAIPEPSAALLGALGALGILRRRRN
jgi:hypothetical protein